MNNNISFPASPNKGYIFYVSPPKCFRKPFFLKRKYKKEKVNNNKYLSEIGPDVFRTLAISKKTTVDFQHVCFKLVR